MEGEEREGKPMGNQGIAQPEGRMGELPNDPVANHMLNVIGHHGQPGCEGIVPEMGDAESGETPGPGGILKRSLHLSTTL